jgi:hypothetical protein
MTTLNNWQETQTRHEQNYRDFLRSVEMLPAALREQPGACGTWSPRQVVAHLAGWYAEAARRYTEMLARPQESKTYDVDAYNAQSVAARASLSWCETLQDLRRQHDALAESVARLPELALATTSGFAEWLDGTGEDCALHAAQLRKWAHLR